MFKQNAFILGEIKGVKKERKKAQTTGKEYDQYSVTLVTATEGVGMIVRKSVYSPDDEKPDFIVNKIANYESMMDRLKNKEKIYGYVMIKPATKDGKPVMYDKVSTYTTDAGKSGISVDAWVTEVPFEDTEDGTIFIFKSSTKTVAEVATNIEVDMLVTEKDDNRLSLIDNETTDYPVTMDVYLKDGVENLATLGQGYRLSLTVEKGKKMVAAKTADLGWDAEAKDTYAPDILRVLQVGKIKGYVSDSISSTDDNSSLF